LKSCDYPKWIFDKVKHDQCQKRKKTIDTKKRNKSAQESKGLAVMPYVEGLSETAERNCERIVRLFRVLYDNSVSCVQTGGTHRSWFKIKAGFRHGCVLAPDSFATGMDWLLDTTVKSCSIGVAFESDAKKLSVQLSRPKPTLCPSRQRPRP